MLTLREGKSALCRIACASGISSILGASRWRQERLLVLGYHGVSVGDEQVWNTTMYVSAETFRRRLKLLRDRQCNVLPLPEAIERLQNRTLPPRSVVITFDDGFSDTYSVAWPILKEFGYTATVYLASYYVSVQHPVFNVMVRYLAWKSHASYIEWPEVLGPGARPLHDGLDSVATAIVRYANELDFSAQQKFEFLSEFASRISVDLDRLRARRAFHLMNSSEVAEMAAQGCDIQLHTHRHRVLRTKDHFVREVQENRAFIQAITGSTPRHYCYPSGIYVDGAPQWLREAGVLSATTCQTGYATPGQDPYRLSRVLDVNQPDAVFEAWTTGVAELLSRRRTAAAPDPVFGDDAEGRASQSRCAAV